MPERKASGSFGTPVTLPIHCAYCGGAVTLQFADWTPEQPARDQLQPWLCPFCYGRNEGQFPGRLAWATRGHDAG